jgi:Flp pilus assembly protein TadG
MFRDLRTMSRKAWHRITRFARAFRRLAGDTGGTEIAEAAAILPVLFLIIMAIFWFGQAFRTYGTLTRAAQEGARAGAAPACSTCTALATSQQATNAVNAVTAAMTIAKLDPTKAQYPSPQPSFNLCAGATGGTGCIGSASGKVCVQAPVQLSNPATGGATGVCGISVSLRYPFTFQVPFASPTIYLTGSARVHMETQ